MTTRVEISKRLLLVNAASTVLRKIVSLGVLFWVYRELAHIERSEMDTYVVVIALMLMFPLLTTVCVAGLRRSVTEAYARGEEQRVTRLVSSMFPVLLGVGVVVLALGAIFTWRIDDVLTIKPEYVGDARLMFGMLIGTVALRVSLAPLGLGIDVRQKFTLRNFIGLGTELLRLSVVLLLFHTLGARALWAVVAMVLASVTEILSTTAVSMALVPALRFRFPEFRRGEIWPLLTFGGWSLLNQVAFMIREVADPFVLNKLGAEGEPATFGYGALADTQIRRTYIEMYLNALPAVTAMHATGQRDQLRRTYFRMSRYALWILLAASAPLVVYRHEFFALYLRDTYSLYAGAATVMALLLARAVVIFPNSILGMIAMANEQIRPLALRAITMSLANLALTIWFVGPLEMGAIGSALATLLVTVVGAPFLMWGLGLRLTGARLLPWLRGAVWPGLIPALCAAPVWLGLQALFPATTWVRLGADVSAGLLAYALGMVLLAFGPADRRDAAAALGKVKRLLRR